MKLTSLAKLVRMGENLDLVEESLRELEKKYSDDSPLMLIQEGDVWKLTVREKYVQLVKGIAHKSELSKTMMETLAVIAYRAPVIQSEVIKIRTNKAYDHLVAIENAGYITRIKQGKSKMIRLTPKFFQYFDVPPDQLKAKFKGIAELEKQIVEHEVIRDEKISERDRLEKARHLAEEENNARMDEEMKTLDAGIQEKEPEVKRLLGAQLEVFNKDAEPMTEIVQEIKENPSVEIIRESVDGFNIVSIPETEKEKKSRLKNAKSGDAVGHLGELEVVKMSHKKEEHEDRPVKNDQDAGKREESSEIVLPETPEETEELVPLQKKQSKIPKKGGIGEKNQEFSDKVSARADALLQELESPSPEAEETERALSKALDEESTEKKEGE